MFMNANVAQPQKNFASSRKKKFIDPAYQMRYSFTLVTFATTEGILLAGVLLAAIFSIIEISPENHIRLFYYIVTISAAMILFLNLLNIGIGILLSHRISGPVYRFTQIAKSVAKGDLSQVIKLREKDELQDLRSQLNDMLDGLRGLVREQNRQIDEVTESVRRLQARSAQSGAGAEDKDLQELLVSVENLKGKFLI